MEPIIPVQVSKQGYLFFIIYPLDEQIFEKIDTYLNKFIYGCIGCM